MRLLAACGIGLGIAAIVFVVIVIYKAISRGG
jgi:hypothetical protein